MPTLLVIDENESVRIPLRFVFANFGFTVVTAENGAAALACVEQHSIDAALVDVHMPGTNGFDVCRELRTRLKTLGREIRSG